MQTTSHILNSQGERLDISFHGGDHLGAMIVIGHGVTGNKDRPLLVAIAEGLSRKGWPSIRFSFSGNGESEGEFEDSCITKEVDDLWSIMKMVPQEKRIAYIGHSMGAAVGVKTAASGMTIQCLISLAGMVDTAGFLEREFGDLVPDKGLMWGQPECPFSTTYAEDMKEIGSMLPEASRSMVPWLLIHGVEDDVVPIEDSRQVFEVARCDKKLIEIPGAGHSFDAETYGLIVDSIDCWLRKSFG
jgi:pimeloyl-ACP methyl ester carboxylesterase